MTWIDEHADAIAAHAERDLEALVAVSSPSGDAPAAEEAIAVAVALASADAAITRLECSSAGHADDVALTLRGSGSARLLLLGHIDTVVAHGDHQPLRREGDRLVGSGAIDMKGGDVLALGVLRALAARAPDFAEATLLLVCDEEWRAGGFAHVERFAHYDACLCFEAGEQRPGDDGGGPVDAVVVTRKAAGTVRVSARGRSAHSGSAPDAGANALLALAVAAQAIASRHDPSGARRLTAVPTVIRSGDAFNVVPDGGELLADIRADGLDAFADVLAAVPEEHGGASLHAELVREWPGMDSSAAVAPLLARAGETIGRPIVGVARGGASDASHFAATVPLTVDGLGPRGGGAHAPHEFVSAASLRPRAELALALADAVLMDGRSAGR